MLHDAHSRPEHANICLWPQAVDYAVWVFNHLPLIKNGVSPNEMWSCTRLPTNGLNCALGCPIYVLDPGLQDGHNIPKSEPCACLGLFIGFFSLHLSLVPLVLNILTGKISPQYHVVFDDRFKTVPSLPLGKSVQKQWNWIFTLPWECYLDVDVDPNGFPINPPSGYELLPSYQQHLPLPLQNQQPATMPWEVDPISHNPEGDAEGVPVGLLEGDQMGVAEGVPVGIPERVSFGLPEGVPVGFLEGVEPTTKGPTTYSPAKQYNNPKDASQANNIPEMLAHGRMGQPGSELLQWTMNRTSSTFF